MRKLVYTIILLSATQVLHAQFLKKIKSKVSDAVNGTSNKPGNSNSQGTQAGGKFTDPAQFGILIKTYTKAEINTAMQGESGGNFDLHFQSFKVVNGQFVAQIGDVIGSYDYQNGKLQNTGQKPLANKSDAYNGSEKDFQSTDFSTLDVTNAILKKGPHIQSGRQPGKIDQDFVFKGKSIGRFMSAALGHNADSSVVVAAGMSYGKGVSYVMTSSTGQTTPLPGIALSGPIVSPNGKMSATIVTNAAGSTAYRIDGTKVVLADYGGGAWVRNSGAIFFASTKGNTILMRNNQVAQVINYPIDLKLLFIGANDDAFCWPGDHCLCFSDNTRFENADAVAKVTINGKDVVYFTAINVITGMLYLCHHDL